MTNHQRKARAAIVSWCKETRKPALSIRHIQPICFVVGFTAPGCLIVATPWVMSEPQLQVFNRQNPLDIVYRFAPNLHPGDWCSTAYVTSPGCGETVAIPVVMP